MAGEQEQVLDEINEEDDEDYEEGQSPKQKKSLVSVATDRK